MDSREEPLYLPTPEETIERMEESKRGWSHDERVRRANMAGCAWQPTAEVVAYLGGLVHRISVYRSTVDVSTMAAPGVTLLAWLFSIDHPTEKVQAVTPKKR